MNYGYPGYPPQYPYGYPSHVPRSPSLSPGLRTAKIIFAVLSLLCWLVALALPAYNDDVFGAATLIFGWSMIFTNGWAFLAWFGNFLFFPGYFIFTLGKRRGTRVAALILGGTAFFFSFGALTVTQVADDIFDGMHSAEPSIGLYVWMFGLLLLPVGSLVLLLADKPQPQEAQPQYRQPVYPQYPNYPPQNYPPPQQTDYTDYLPKDYPPIPRDVSEQPHNPWER